MKSHKNLYAVLNLHLFDGEGAPAAEAAAPAPGGEKAKAGKNSNPLSAVQYGKQAEVQPAAQEGSKKAEPETTVTSDTAEARKAEFERLVKGEYKDLFDARVQQNINARFKETETYKAKAAQADALTPVLDMLASKYGVDGSNVDALVKAIQEDDSYYEEEAMNKGLSVEQQKHMKKIERENAEFKRVAQEQQQKANADRIFSQWQQQSDLCKQAYPNFDLRNECSDPQYGSRFLSMLKSGVDVKTAYEVIHKDDILGGAMQYTAQAVQQKTVNDIRARGMRPSENGASGAGAAAIVKTDPKTFTKKDRDEISRRVLRGDRSITFD